MATTILGQNAVCDGYDVRLLLDGGKKHTLHFAGVPAKGVVTAAIASLETQLAAEEAAKPTSEELEMVDRAKQIASEIQTKLEACKTSEEFDALVVKLDTATVSAADEEAVK